MQSPIMPLPSRGGELGSEIAHLVGVREEDEVGLRGFDNLTQRERESVRRVFFEQVVFDEQNFVELEPASSSARRATPLPMTSA